MTTDWLDTFEISPGLVAQDQDSVKQQDKLHRMIREISREAKSVQDRCQRSSDASLIHLVEVFCHENSELTRQIQNLHGKAVRMGLNQGDLSTPDGRKTLFEIMFMNRP